MIIKKETAVKGRMKEWIKLLSLQKRKKKKVGEVEKVGGDI